HRGLGVELLRIGAPGVLLPRGAVGHQPRRVELGRRVGEHPADALVLVEPAPEGLPLRAPGLGLLEQALCRAEAARGDVQALLAEPLAADRVGLAARAEELRVGDLAVLEDELGVAVLL